MKKRLATLLAVTALAGAATVSAANPFTDVQPDSWAYKAVAQLASEGIIDGYPDGTFRGQNDITRYEMAQLIARAMAREEMANASQRAVINQLAAEFSQELNGLGVRVAQLENRVGNVKLSGDARVRFDHQDAQGVYIDVRKDNTKLMVGGEEVTFAKAGVYAVDFPADQMEATSKAELFFGTPPKLANIGVSPDNEVVKAMYNGSPIPPATLMATYMSSKIILTPEQLGNNPGFAMLAGLGIKFDKAMTASQALAYAVKQLETSTEPAAKIALQALQPAVETGKSAEAAVQDLPQNIYALASQIGNKPNRSESWTYRLRLKADAMINDKTKAGARFVMANAFGATPASGQVVFDRLWVQHQTGPVTWTAGRQGAFLGGGLVLDSTLDGVTAQGQVGPFQLTAGYGYPVDIVNNPKALDQTVTFAQVGTKVADKVQVALYATQLTSKKVDNEAASQMFGPYFGMHHTIYGVSAETMLGPVQLHAEYAKRTKGEDNGLILPVLRDGKGRDAYVVGASYGMGQSNLMLQYFRLGQNSPILESTYDQRYLKNWKGFVATYEHNFSDAMQLKMVYAFKGSAVEKYNGAVAPAARYYAQLEYKF